METNFVHCKSKRYFNCYDFPKKKIYKGYNYWEKILQRRILLIASELSGVITLQEIQLVSGTYKCSTGTLNKIL